MKGYGGGGGGGGGEVDYIPMATLSVTIRLIRDGEEGGCGGMEVGGWGGGRLYTYGYSVSHHQNDSCIKMGSDENHFNVSLIARDKVTRQYK